MTPRRRVLLLKLAVWLVALAPLGWALWRLFFGDGLGANPIEEAEHLTGLSTLVLLVTTLAVTPLRLVTGWNRIQKVRRLLGLFAFFYVCIHFSVYVGLDQFFGWSYILEDIAERPYILVGFAAFLLLIPLAVTSTRGWIRRLGRGWQRLHRLAYLAAVLGVIHYFWVTKADDRGPTLVAVILGLLLVARLPGIRETLARRSRGSRSVRRQEAGG